MATHSSILVCRILWTEEPGGLQFHGVAKSWTQLSNENFHQFTLCLGNPTDLSSGMIYMSIPKETVLLRILLKFQPVCLPRPV